MTSPDSAIPGSCLSAVTAADAPQAGRLPNKPPNHHRSTHSGVDTSRFFSFHLRAAIFPVTAAAVFFGWRAMGIMAVIVAFAAAGTRLWQRVGLRGAQLRYPHVLWLATLLALTLPVHLFSNESLNGTLLWPILPAAGLLIVVVTWALGGLATASIHPVVVAHLALVIFFGGALMPRHVLQRHALLFGDALDVPDRPIAQGAAYSWLEEGLNDRHDAIHANPASLHLGLFTIGQQDQNLGWLALEGLLRDRMPPLEDLIIGGHPSPIGAGSAMGIVVGGLFLVYRGVSNFRVPMAIVLSAAVTLLILPIPVAVSGDARTWRWVAMLQPGIGWPTAFTFVNYELLAGPLIFMALFLATDPSVRPTTRGGQHFFAIAIGCLSAFCQLYASVAWGSYLALLVVSLISRTIDDRSRIKPLV